MRKSAFLLMLLLTLCAGLPAQTLHLKFKTIDVPGALYTILGDINDSGDIVGYYLDANNFTHGLLLTSAGFTTIDNSNGTKTLCWGINNSGTIVGCYDNGNGTLIGFVYDHGAFTNVVPPGVGAISSVVTGINDYGQIAGAYAGSDFFYHGFVFDLRSQTYTFLPDRLIDGTKPWGINNRGFVTVATQDATRIWYSSVYSLTAGAYVGNVNVPGASGGTYANQVADSGDIALQWLGVSGSYQGALWHAGHYYTFNYPGSFGTAASGINNHHVVVGNYYLFFSTYHGFVASYSFQ